MSFRPLLVEGKLRLGIGRFEQLVTCSERETARRNHVLDAPPQ